MFDRLKKTFLTYCLRRRYGHWRYYRNYAVTLHNDHYRVKYKGAVRRASCPTASSSHDKVLIIGSGPSVSDIAHLQSIWSMPLLCMNGSHKLYTGREAKFDYYLVSDIGFIRRQWENFSRGISVSKTVLLDHRAYIEACKKNEQVFDGKEIILFNLTKRPFDREATQPIDRPQESFFSNGKSIFSINPNLGYASSCTVAYLALQVVVNLGFKRVYFSGMDFGGERFYSEKVSEKSMLDKDYECCIEPDFRFASSVCKEMGISLRNVSQNSRLPSSVISKISVANFESELSF